MNAREALQAASLAAAVREARAPRETPTPPPPPHEQAAHILRGLIGRLADA